MKVSTTCMPCCRKPTTLLGILWARRRCLRDRLRHSCLRCICLRHSRSQSYLHLRKTHSPKFIHVTSMVSKPPSFMTCSDSQRSCASRHIHVRCVRSCQDLQRVRQLVNLEQTVNGALGTPATAVAVLQRSHSQPPSHLLTSKNCLTACLDFIGSEKIAESLQ